MTYKEIKLGDVVTVESGGAFKSKSFNEEKLGLPLIRIRDVTKGYSETYYSGKYDDKHIVNNGDLLITMDGEFNIREWRGGKALLNQRVCRIKSNLPELKERFLLYVMPTLLKQIEDKTPFVTVKHLSVKKLEEANIPLPPMEIQQKIVKVLDKARFLTKKRKQQIEALSSLKQSIFLDMFDNPGSNKKNFMIDELGNHTNLVSSGSTPRGGSKTYLNEGIPLIRSQNVLSNRFAIDNVVYISEDVHHSMQRSQLLTKDVLFNITGASIGRSVVFEGEDNSANVNQHVCIIRLKNTVNPYYLSYYLATDYFQSNVVSKNIGATRQAFNYTQIKNFKIMLPEIGLQNEFECKIKKVNGQIKLCEISLNKLETLFNALSQKAFNGELFQNESTKLTT